MKKYVMTLVKYLKPPYFTYFLFGTLLVNILKFLILPEDNLILFVSFGGKKFDDSPRMIYEKMIQDPRFDRYELVWGFHDPSNFDIPRGKAIKTDSFQYYLTALKARSWITNSTVERGLNFKGRRTFYFNTWHGTPIKKMGADLSQNDKPVKQKAQWGVDVMTAQSTYESAVCSQAFQLDKEKFFVCGLPRNDELVNVTEETQQAMKKKIGIPLDKKVILYAPTYREYERDRNFNCVLDPSIHFGNWKKELGNEYVVLLRAHYEVAKVLNIETDDQFVLDVSAYPVLNDLMIASDLLISD